MDDHTKRTDCTRDFQRIWEEMEKANIVHESLREKGVGRDLSLMEMRTQISHLVVSMSGLTKVLWGMIIMGCSTGIAFIIWYIQTGG